MDVDLKRPRVDDEEADEDVGELDEDEEGYSRPKKADHRQRAHLNPLARYHVWRPARPAEVPLADYYPAFYGPARVVSGEAPPIRWVDLGCGFGSLVLALARHAPHELVLGMEIRRKPTTFVQKRVIAARREAKAALPAAERQHRLSDCDNAWAVETNSMKFMPNFFEKGQLTKLFICFPDPHFKKRNVRKRAVSPTLLAEYAYCMALGARLYTITDVSELTDWMVEHLTRFPLFRRVPNDQLAADPVVPLLLRTDEGMKVTRNNGNMFVAAFDRVCTPEPLVDEVPLPREVAAAAAATAGYTPQPGGERRGREW